MSLNIRQRRAAVCFIACLSLALGMSVIDGAMAAQRDDAATRRLKLLLSQHRELRDDFAKSAERIAVFCERNNLNEQATAIRETAKPVDHKSRRLRELPRKLQGGLPDNLPEVERQWRVEIRHLQSEHAIKLQQLSRKAVEMGNIRFAYELVYEALHHDPDCVPVRRFLGFEQSGDEWVTAFEAHMHRNRMVETEQFGWLPKQQVSRYEQGERNFKGRWISDAKEAELRRDFNNAWTVTTEHYVIKTNYSLERGVQLSRQLEAFYRTFFQTFAGFLTTQDQQRTLAQGRRQRRSLAGQKFKIHYYRDKQDYVEHLRPRVPLIDITTGLYLTDTGIAYFYHQPEMDEDPNGAATRTIFHEATHQLFSETRKTRRGMLVGEKAHFWIIEGIACYMESFEQKGDGYSLGDPDYQRFRAARFRYLNDDYYIPLQQFDSLGAEAIQHSRQIRRLYSQASGLSHFFMHYHDGKYRDALIEHLSQLYSRDRKVRENPDTLAELTGMEYQELDREYGEYLRAQQEELEATAEQTQDDQRVSER